MITQPMVERAKRRLIRQCRGGVDRIAYRSSRLAHRCRDSVTHLRERRSIRIPYTGCEKTRREMHRTETMAQARRAHLWEHKLREATLRNGAKSLSHTMIQDGALDRREVDIAMYRIGYSARSQRICHGYIWRHATTTPFTSGSSRVLISRSRAIITVTSIARIHPLLSQSSPQQCGGDVSARSQPTDSDRC